MATLKELIANDDVQAESAWDNNPTDTEGWPAGSSHWKVTLRRKDQTLTVPFHQGPAITGDPTAHGVLESLLLDASCGEQGFDEYCSEFGRNPDSRKEYATWEACRQMAQNLREFLGDDYETYKYASH